MEGSSTVSREKLDELERRAKEEQTRAARTYARIEQLKEDIARVEKGLKELGIGSIEEAKERIARADEIVLRLLNESADLLGEVEG